MIRVRNINVSITSNNLIDKISNKLKIDKKDILKYNIVKKSIDARRKNNILFVYEVDVELLNEDKILKSNKSKDIFITPNLKYKYNITGNITLNNRPIIVGSGPAGLFCAYFLAEAGYKPIILERGDKVDARVKKVEEFFNTNKLDINSNVVFGEGGAGTFSDGKLNTLVKDKLNRSRRIFEIFVECGAPKEIMYDAHPHIGTDILRKVVVNLRNKIIDMGGEFRFKSTVTDLIISNNKICGVIVNNKEKIESDVVVLAIGHSARDTFYMLKEKNILMRAKPFAVGVRIEHPREMIDSFQYGKFASILGPSSYKLTYKTKTGRGVYSFCMCPGGFVVNASSEYGYLSINGMSNYKRDERNSNSAIIVTVGPKDFGQDPMAGLEFQRELERKAYIAGHGLIPVQLYKDFCKKKVSTKFLDIYPNTKGSYNFANLNEIFPNYISDSLKEGIDAFSHKIKDFNRKDAVLLGVESRTSSPVIIVRNEFGEAITGLYPAGEGAGYAGGITTSAMDGVKTFENIIKKYKTN